MRTTDRAKAHDEIDRIFYELLPARGMAVREAQMKLCHDMFTAMDTGRIALCDAGVGLGKTYAYLAAGVLFRKYTEQDSERPILVTTASIALQNAVLDEYIPFLSEVMLEAGMIDRPLGAVLRKGKAHYACDDRLIKRINKANLDRKNERNKRALLSLRKHLDLDSVAYLSSYDRDQVCVPPLCDCYLTDCRYQQFVRESRSPEYIIQVCNHNFFLADAIHRESGIPGLVPDYCAAIIDEGHKLPAAARQMFGKSLSIQDMADLATGFQREQYILAAEKLTDVFAPIAADLTTHGDEDYMLTKERKTLYGKAIKTILSIRKTIGSAVTPPLKSKLMDAWAVLDLFHRNDRGFILYADADENGSPALTAANSNYAERMRETLWDRNIPMILTSGTLAVGDDFTRLKYSAEIIGKTIRQKRDDKKWTQETLGKKLGVTGKQVSNYEKGKPLPPLDVMLNLCNIFECELGHLLGEDDYTESSKVKTIIHNTTGLTSTSMETIEMVMGTSRKSIEWGYESERYRRIMNSLFTSGQFIRFIESIGYLDEQIIACEKIFEVLREKLGDTLYQEALSCYKSKTDYLNDSDAKKLRPELYSAINQIDVAIDTQDELSYVIKVARYELLESFQALISDLYPRRCE